MKATRRQLRIAERLQEIAHDGRLTPAEVVDDARPDDSILHPEFEWRDDIAAEKFRQDQARQIIRSVPLIVTDNSIVRTVPFYVRDPAAPLDQQGYVSVVVLRTEEQLAREALQGELERAMATLARARTVAEALGLAAEVETMRDGLVTLRRRLADAA